jgi:hypothetical protein
MVQNASPYQEKRTPDRSPQWIEETALRCRSAGWDASIKTGPFRPLKSLKKPANFASIVLGDHAKITPVRQNG